MTRRTIAAVLAVFLGASGLTLGVLALALRDGGGGLREGRHSLIPPMGMRIAEQGSHPGWAIAAIVLAVLAVAAGLAAFWALRRASEPAAAGPAPGWFEEWHHAAHSPRSAAAAAESPVMGITPGAGTTSPAATGNSGPPDGPASADAPTDQQTEAVDAGDQTPSERPPGEAKPGEESESSE